VASVSITRVHERSLIGIEVPNKQKASLGIGSLLGGREFAERKDKLTMTLGRDIYGNPVFVDMTKMPHLLIAGTTGSGKSSLIHALINSLIYNKKFQKFSKKLRMNANKFIVKLSEMLKVQQIIYSNFHKS
jgi:S-DNA-T family DNA segregation ATPase FtsK/SpoIIIE